MADIGKRIREKREALGITQEELAVRLGYKNKSTIAKIENGTNDIVQSKVVEFANALNTSVSYLMGWKEELQAQSQLQISQSEQSLLHKYHSLDDKGKHTVDTVLEMEYNRCKDNCSEELIIKPKEDKSHLLPMAAHNDTITEPEELEKTIRDLAKLKRPKK
ncbi:helix-turn-helix domain-containing protein [Lacrimispora sp.]|uniref:helix-turn-helix domain-containing protein n=1 Tax=Lacrimispora sp. TaxID=2719234 RepID=UPI003994A86C